MWSVFVKMIFVFRISAATNTSNISSQEFNMSNAIDILPHVRKRLGMTLMPFRSSHVRVTNSSSGADNSQINDFSPHAVDSELDEHWLHHLVGLGLSLYCMKRFLAERESYVGMGILLGIHLVLIEPNITAGDWCIDLGVTFLMFSFFWWQSRKNSLGRRSVRLSANGDISILSSICNQIQRCAIGIEEWCCRKSDGPFLRVVISFCKRQYIFLYTLVDNMDKYLQSYVLYKRAKCIVQHGYSLCFYAPSCLWQHISSSHSFSKQEHQQSDISVTKEDTKFAHHKDVPFVVPSPLRSGHRRRDSDYSSNRSACGSLPNEVQAFHGSSVDHQRRSVTEVRGYHSMVETCIEAHQLVEAEECINVMKTLKIPIGPSCLSLAEAFVKDKRFDIAMQWLLVAREDNSLPLQPYNSLLDACAKAGALEFAELVLENMIVAGVHPDTVSYNSVIDACSKAKEVARAGHWVEQMKQRGVRPDVVSFSAVLNAYAQCGMFAEANDWLKRMENGEEGVHPNVFSYNTCINAQVRSGQAVDPVAWTRRMRTHRVRPNVVTYTTLCQPAATRGDYLAVEELMANIKLEKLPVNHYCLAVLLNAYANAQPRQCDRAEHAFIDAVDRGLPINGTALRSLQRCLTRNRFVSLCSSQGVDYSRLMNASQRHYGIRDRVPKPGFSTPKHN